MLEAARLLRFTDLTVGEVAFRAGFEDQLYFSRAFKRQYGDPPMSYRAHLRDFHERLTWGLTYSSIRPPPST